MTMSITNWKVLAVLAICILLFVWHEYSNSQTLKGLRTRLHDQDAQIDSLLHRLYICDYFDNITTSSLPSSASSLAVDDPNAIHINETFPLNATTSNNNTLTVAELYVKIDEYREKSIQGYRYLRSMKQLLLIKKLFNTSGYMHVIFLFIILNCEIYFGHSHIYTEANEESAGIGHRNYMGNKVFRRFVANKFPLSTFIFWLVIYLCGLITWVYPYVPILSRSTYVTYTLRVIIFYTVAMKLCFFYNNLMQLRTYLPNKKDEVLKAVSSISWWLWFVSKIVAPDPTLWNVVRLLVSIYSCLPVYYFYYYGNSCLPKMLSSVNTELVCDSWYLVNMLLHISYVYCICSAIKVCAFGSPLWLRRILSPVIDYPGRISLLLVSLLVSMVISILRQLWFTPGSSCSWFACCLSWIFVHVHIFEIIEVHPYIGVIEAKHAIYHDEKIKFIVLLKEACNISSNKKSSSNGNNDDSDGDSIEENSAKAFATVLYDHLIDKTLRDYILGIGPISHATRDDRNADGSDSNSSSSDQVKLDNDLKLAYQQQQLDMFTLLATKMDTNTSSGSDSVSSRKLDDILGVHLYIHLQKVHTSHANSSSSSSSGSSKNK